MSDSYKAVVHGILTSNNTLSHERAHVIDIAVKVEYAVNYLLTRQLGISKSENTVSFSNKSGSLSFIQKVTLLSDLDVVSKSDKEKLIKFAAIRNKFAHVMDVTNYGHAISDDIFNSLKKWYPELYDNQKAYFLQAEIFYSSLEKDVLQIIQMLEYKLSSFQMTGMLQKSIKEQAVLLMRYIVDSSANQAYDEVILLQAKHIVNSIEQIEELNEMMESSEAEYLDKDRK